MKSKLKILVAALACLLVVLCVASLGNGLLRNLKSFNANSVEDATIDAISVPIAFTSIDDYINYSIGNNNSGDAEINTSSNSNAGYYLPVEIPEDAELVSIVIDESGTMFNFRLNRLNPIIVDPDSDQYILNLLNTYRIRVYDAQNPNWVDHGILAANLANSLGAVPAQLNGNPLPDTYYGVVKASIRQPNGTFISQEVGQQWVYRANSYCGGVAVYSYFPASVFVDEAFRLMQIEKHTINNNPTM